MNASKIEQTIEDIYAYLEGCRPSKIYANKIVVDRDELLDLLEELRMSVPDEIRRYQKVITNRDNIINEAHQRAENMVSQAQAKTDQLLDESEIMQAAYTRAEEIMRQANEEATQLLTQAQNDSDEMRKGALVYTNDLLADAKNHIKQGLLNSEAAHATYEEALKQSLQIIDGNLNELASSLGNAPAPAPTPAPAQDATAVESDKKAKEQLEPEAPKKEVLELEEDAFLKNDII
ncbi:MAG: hypothetical protein K5639_03305 [Eubacterium sp.]|nr:hypothetical protein [Eubacterium sp.]